MRIMETTYNVVRNGVYETLCPEHRYYFKDGPFFKVQLITHLIFNEVISRGALSGQLCTDA